MWSDIWHSCTNDKIRFHFDKVFDSNSISGFSSTDYLLWWNITDFIIGSRSPITIATDGGKRRYLPEYNTPASIVLGVLDIKTMKLYQQGIGYIRTLFPCSWEEWSYRTSLALCNLQPIMAKQLQLICRRNYCRILLLGAQYWTVRQYPVKF